ncbi:MAG: LAGLIDADG family homing endonuclease [Candidatus Paceibacterota bacterium]|jgi:intein-encoded DNA endonuclease-like protein
MYKYKKINQNFFKIWNHEMSYTIGFMFADGGISINSRGGCYFALYSNDEDLLKKIKYKMGSDHKISQRSARSGNVFRFQVGSKEMVGDLKKLGFYENKIKRMRIPEIPNNFIPDFIRGFFDGDGNVWMGISHKNSKSKITIQTSFTSASKCFLIDLQLHLGKLGLLGGSIFNIKNKDCSRITYSVNDTLKLHKIMYNIDCLELYLPRKRKIFEKYIKLGKKQS